MNDLTARIIHAIAWRTRRRYYWYRRKRAVVIRATRRQYNNSPRFRRFADIVLNRNGSQENIPKATPSVKKAVASQAVPATKAKPTETTKAATPVARPEPKEAAKPIEAKKPAPIPEVEPKKPLAPPKPAQATPAAQRPLDPPTNTIMPGNISIPKASELIAKMKVDFGKLRDFSVAVVVPTYNDSAFLADCLESVRQQTFANWRCYVVDDASPQDVDHVMKRFQDDERFVLLRHAKNAGLSAARNTGLRASNEDLVQFLDADDLLTPWALKCRVAEMIRLWEDPTVAGAYGQIYQCPEETSLDTVKGWNQRPNLKIKDFLEADGEAPFNVHAPLMRTSVIAGLGGFDESFINGAEDWHLWHRMLRHGYKVVPVNQVVGAYRQRVGSMIRDFAELHLQRAEELFQAANSEVITKKELVVGAADMPLSRSRQARSRAIRAARWLGLEVAGTGEIPDTSSHYFDFIDPIALAETDPKVIINAARGGVIRGLGLSPLNVPDMRDKDRRRINMLSEMIADSVFEFAAEQRGSYEPSSDALDITGDIEADVALIASTSADVPVLLNATKSLSDKKIVAFSIDVLEGDGGAQQAWQLNGIRSVSYNEVALGRCRPALVIARKPFGPATLAILTAAENWGSEVRILSEKDRLLEVEESPSKNLDYQTARASELKNIELPEVKASVPWNCTNYSGLLAREETNLDDRSYQRLMELKDSKKGEKCVIIGNGPSLNEIDLSLLDGVSTFGVNSIFLAKDRLPNRLSYYVVEDTSVFRENIDDVKAFDAEYKLFPTLYKPSFSEDEIDDSTIFFRMNMGFYGRSTGTLCYPRFSTNAAQRVFCGQSVTIINLQLAYWLGFKEIALIGMDFSYVIPDDVERKGDVIISKSDDVNHFHPDYFGAGKSWKDPKLDRVLINYRLAKEVFEADNRRIVNSTVGGKLEVFDRVDLAKFI